MDSLDLMHDAIRQRDCRRMLELINGATFARLLGMETVELREGYARIVMQAREDMLNHFSLLHGGATASLADQAFAAACNTMGRPCVGLQLALTYVNPAHVHESLTAECWVRHDGKRISTIELRVVNDRQKTIVTGTGLGYYLRPSTSMADDEPKDAATDD